MAESTVRGHVAWHELLTPDAGASHTFYARVVGWKSQAWEHDPSYRMFAASTGPLGGTLAQSEGPAHWRHYIEAPDLDATTEQAVGLGATVQTPPTALPNGARYAVLTDPQGATFCLVASVNLRPPTAPRRGEFSWMELATDDVESAIEFYKTLFGWEIASEHDMGPIGVYYTLRSGEAEFAGVFKKPAEMTGPPSWLGYVRVKDIDKAIKAATKAGGTLLVGPMEVPGGDLVAQFVDPQGAVFAVHMFAADKKPAGEESASTAQPPATIEVSGAPSDEEASAEVTPRAASRARSGSASRAKAKSSAASSSRKKAAKKKAPKTQKKKAKVAAKAGKRAPAKRKSAKSVDRAVRKAVKVGSRTSRSKAKAAPGRKKSAGKAKKRASARARKSK